MIQSMHTACICVLCVLCHIAWCSNGDIDLLALHKSSTAFMLHQAQAQEHDLEGAKSVHKMQDDEEDEGGDAEDMDVGNEEGEVEEI